MVSWDRYEVSSVVSWDRYEVSSVVLVMGPV